MRYDITGVPWGCPNTFQAGRWPCAASYLVERKCISWSEWRDSNPRPLVPQTSALTGLRYTPILALIEKALLRRNAPCEAGRSKGRIAPRFPLSRTILRAPRPKLPAAHGIKDVLARRQFGQGRSQPRDLFGR
jgi:hypothetical protein